ncbi:hypothetical protein CICLE_v10023198mg [Citrus x clementina]|uniref:Uncharacterized protein n=1 Tax=Citrus clementina TaxID=85681 RepID=V4VQN3_CITCL|nr:hypothetical protein CICLE_v10023198mg [Citrus x clementina]
MTGIHVMVTGKVGWLEIGETVRGRSKVVKAVGVGYYKISGVIYQNMTGNSAIKGAMTLECSASNPCKGIRL